MATIGALNSPEQMEEIIASGKADVVYMARALLADPYLPRKVTENREQEIVKCLRCFTCMAERAATSTRRCTVNPLIGREIEGDEVAPAPVKKKVLVAGGGPGGLYAAYTAARRGHQVILCEKEDKLGGILKSEQALPFKHEMYELAGTYELLARQAGVEIRTNTEVTKEYAKKENADALIIAVGSRPLLLKEIEKYVTVHTGCRGLEVTKEGILCENKEAQKLLVPGSTVICALGQRSRTDVVEELNVLEVCREAAEEKADDIPYYFMGHHAFIAKKCDERFRREDGKCGNIIYSKEKLFKKC